MMAFLQSYVRRGQRLARHMAADGRAVLLLTGAGYALAGLLLSAASLGNCPQPFVLALLCAAPPGWPVILLALGGAGGYPLFWGQAGSQGLAWILGGLLGSAVLAGRPVTRQNPVLMPALAGMLTAVCGTAFRLWLGDETTVSMYLLRIFLAAGGTWLFTAVLDRRDVVADWLAGGVAVLALAQVAPARYLDLGYIGAALLAAAGAFPAGAMAGLALDLARITPVPMTAVLCLGYLPRLIPRAPSWLTWLGPAAVYLPVAALSGAWDLTPLPGLVLGGAASLLIPGTVPVNRRRGSTGVLQVRLEMAAEVLAQAEQILLEAPEAPVDAQALVCLAGERACGSCPCRKGCRERENVAKLPGEMLDRPLASSHDLPFSCRKAGRVWAELRRSQEQLRSIRAEHRRREEYRGAVLQQYRFLSEYLRELSDWAAAPTERCRLRYEPEVAAATAGKEPSNGDFCVWFAGTGSRYYVLLCDGMGTGLGAAKDGETAGEMLRRLLRAGLPAEHALESLNSLCALRGRAGAVTVDLLELELDTGRASIFKWGAAPSYLLSHGTVEKIGTAGPPPGLSVTEHSGEVERLSLRRGETLVLLSDGAGGEEALRRAGERRSGSLGELADRIVEYGREAGMDDATAAAVRLRPAATATR